MAQPRRALMPSDGAENYPFDPAVRIEELRGLERLRAVADRKHAEHLYVLYMQAERNSVASATQGPTQATTLDALERVAARALDGEFGPDARELAEYLLLNNAAQRRNDETALRAFGAGLRRLRNPC